ncbi:MAG: HAMP domain-containing histidine kinase [Saprospiraceae bacterium]|nr:HAMP domain-containing histidine kinase [Saprospiraceae bacterium]
MQIRTKLTLQFISIGAGILLFSLFYIYTKFSEITEDEFYNSLRSKALMTAEMVLHDEEKMQPLAQRPRESSHLPIRENITIYNARLQRVFSFNQNSEDISLSVLQNLKFDSERRFQLNDRYALGLQHRSHSGREYFIVAESIFNSAELKNLRQILVFTFFLGVGIVAAGGWVFAGQAMAPVSRIVDQVDQILPSELSTRLQAHNNHDELSRLVQTFNRMLDRIQLAFRMQKSFISNVSHELKNPLSVIISQLEVSLTRPRNAEEYHQTLNSVLEDTRNLNEVAEKLLQLARVHSDGADILFDSIRLDDVLLQTSDTLLRQYPDYHIAFDLEGVPESEEQLCVSGNESLLRLAFLNLMDNGCKFSPDKHVSVKVMFNPGGRHCVEIADHGPGITSKDLNLIFQPFYRSAQNLHVRGSGIGLSLVDSILKLHRISLQVISGTGHGSVFRLEFPG